MTRFSLLCVLLLAAGVAQAQDRFSVGVGADYSTGDYGSDTTTEILSVPLTARYTSGNWTYKASIPWMRVQGDANVVPGLGAVDNRNPRGRGRGRVVDDPDAADTGSTSGIGDLRLSATYGFDTGGPLGIDLTGTVKIATADEDKGLGTGAEDYGIALDLYREVAGTLLFGGAGYTELGDSTFIEVDSVINANAGASWAAGNGRVGAMYDWREAVTAEADDRSEITGFYSFPLGGNRVQVYGVRGLSDGSPEWGAGVSFTTAF